MIQYKQHWHISRTCQCLNNWDCWFCILRPNLLQNPSACQLLFSKILFPLHLVSEASWRKFHVKSCTPIPWTRSACLSYSSCPEKLRNLPSLSWMWCITITEPHLFFSWALKKQSPGLNWRQPVQILVPSYMGKVQVHREHCYDLATLYPLAKTAEDIVFSFLLSLFLIPSSHNPLCWSKPYFIARCRDLGQPITSQLRLPQFHFS